MTLPGFMLCETCGGAGILEPPISGNDPHGAFANVSCPDCVDGLVPPEGMVEAAAKAHWSTEGRDDWWAVKAMRVALVAAARWEGDTK